MNDAGSVLLTDLYQLTMLQAYFVHGMAAPATFEMYVRRLPPNRNFLVAAGLEQVLEYLENLRFTAAELAWLRDQAGFRPDFVDYLAGLRFSGDVAAMREGTVFFAEEPILQISAPLPEAQLVESRIINLLQYSTLIASKAARTRLVAPDKLLVDFGMRRAHGAEAGLLAARASYIAGFAGSATVLAGQRYGIPVFGTMAHSFILAHDEEAVAFERFAAANPDNVVLLIDTYDSRAGAEQVVALAGRLRERGITIRAVRLDSGDIRQLAGEVRRILDAGGLTSVKIFASGNLDEQRVQELVAAGAPIDGFGIGTRLDVSADAPYLECAYKLQEYAGLPRRKRSEGKANWPGRKQVYRTLQHGVLHHDVVALETDVLPGEPLLEPVMRGGRRTDAPLPLEPIRQFAARQLQRLPPELVAFEPAQYPVEIAPSLQELAARLDSAARVEPA